MKRIFCPVTVLAALALGTTVFAGAFTAGDIVVYRIGDGTQPVTNYGMTVFLDEYTPASISNAAGGFIPPTPVQSIQMPTNWVGAQAPLIASGPGSEDGLMTRSVDGRFLVLTGYGATIGQITNPVFGSFPGISTNQTLSGSSTTNAVTVEDVPRVVGLVDGNGRIYTSTTVTNSSEEGDDIRSAASLDGTNIWLGGSVNLVKYTTRGSLVATPVCANTAFSPMRAVGIFGNTLYIDKSAAFGSATNTTAILTNVVGGVTNITTVNPFGGALPVVSIPTNFVPISTIGALSAQAFAMFNLTNANPSGPDTLYLADSFTNFPGDPVGRGGGLLKFCYTNNTWVYVGAIGAEDAYGVVGVKNNATNVTLYITEGTNATLYYYVDTSGYGGNPQNSGDGGQSQSEPLWASQLINVRGIAVVPLGGDSGTITGPGLISVGPPYGPYFRGPQGGSFNPSSFTYSVANLGTTMTTCTVTYVGFGTNIWVTVSPSSFTLSSGVSTTVSVTPNANANSLNGGQAYTGAMLFHNGNAAGKVPYTNVATMVVDAFYVTPTTNFVSVGSAGGPFAPTSAVYAVSNAIAGALSWSAFTSNNWTSLSATGGSLPGHASTNVTVSINSNANSLVNPGVYDDYLTFSNVSAGIKIATTPEIILQVASTVYGLGIFDDFSTYTPGNVVGQNNWTSANSYNPVQITNGLYSVPGGCVNALGTSQQPYKYVSAEPLTNSAAYAILGMSITFTNAPSSPNYVFGLGTAYLTWDDAGILASGGGYVWTTELNAFETGGGPHGTNVYNFGQQYQVFLVADFVNSNAWVFVNPGTSDFASMMGQTPAVWSGGESDCSYCAGASPEGWESVTAGQYSSCPTATQPGYVISRLAASTNYADVYNYLQAGLTAAPSNSWINAASGKWETGANWSSGVAPSLTNSADLITNPTNKTVTIDATTVLSNTVSMTISNLTVSAPPGSTNTLFLNNAGTATPLSILNALIVGTNGAVVVGNQSVVQAFGNLLVGVRGGTGALTITPSGTVTVTNASGNAVLEVRSGTLSLDGGTVTVNQLVLTNGANSQFAFPAGALSSGGTFVTNNQVFVVGDGTDAATYHLLGGVHNFANNLEIRTNAALTGCGTINGNVVVDSGGTVQANCGSALSFSGGTVTNNGAITASNGTVLNFYGLVVNHGVVNATNGGAQFYGGIVNTGTILTPPETNSWTGGNGKWENSNNWSRAAAPSLTDLADAIANAGNNTVTIDASTSSNFPSSLTISNLIVGAPGPMTNTLFLSNAGTNVPLVVFNSVSVNSGGSMLLTNSALQVGGTSGGALTVDGQLTLDSGTIWVSSNLLVGVSNPLSLVTIWGGALYVTNAAHSAVTEVRYGTLVLTGGVYFTDSLLITNTGAAFLNDGGTFTITGLGQVDQGTQTVASGTTQLSSNLVVGASANSTGTVNVTGGQLIATNAPITIGSLGVGTMTVSNGTVATTGVDLGAGTNSQGTLTLQDGSTVTISSNLTAGSASGAAGTVSVTGGQLVVTNGTVGVGNSGALTNGSGVGLMTVSGGTVLANQILLGSSAGGEGQLTIQSTGLVSLTGPNASLVADGDTIDIEGGELYIPNGAMTTGINHPSTVTIVGGIATCSLVNVGDTDTGAMNMSGGQMTVTTLLDIGVVAGSIGSVWMTGGQLTATNQPTTDIIIGVQGVGQMSISNGIVSAAVMIVGNGSSYPGTLTLAGGTLTVNSLVLPNPVSRFNFTGGWLNTWGITNSNGQILTMGDGVTPTTWSPQGGISLLGNGVQIATNATVSGFGTITGNLVNYGLLSSGSGTLSFLGTVTNYATILTTAGGTINFQGPVVNYGLILTNSSVFFSGGIFNHGLLLDPAADADGDGMNNLDEALAGTNPTNPASLFRTTSVTTIGNNVLVTWTTVGGHSYVVQTNAPPLNGSYLNTFTDLSPVISVPGLGESTTNYLDVGGATNTPSRYYRVRLAQ